MTTLDRLAPIILDALAHASLIAAALVLALLLLRAGLRDRLSPRLRSLLWTLVLARLLIPVSLPAPSSPVPALTPAALTPRPLAALTPPSPAPSPTPRIAPAIPPRQAPPPAAESRLSTPAVILLVYLAGAAVTGALLLAGIVRSSRLVRRAAQIADPDAVSALERAKADLNLAGPIMLAQSPDCPTPVLIGTLRPVVLLPQGLASQLSPDELRDLLMHELAHVKRRDIPLAWLWSIACILHWFNPLVHVAARCVRVDREPACDRLALSRLGPARAAAYGRTLLRLVAALPSPNPAVRPVPAHAGVVEAFAARSSAFKERIRMIASYAPSRPRPLISAVLAFAVLGLGALSFTRSPAQAQAQPASAEFNHVEYRFTGYTADDSGVARTGPKTRLEVIWGDEPATPDVPKAPAAAADRLTLIIRDEAKVPLVARLLKPDALRLRADLHQAIASRAADQADPRQAKSLKPDPAAPELVMAHERLSPGAGGLSPFTITRFYVHPTTTEQPHLPVEITFETVIASGDMAWAASVAMPIAAARTLLADIEAAFAKRQIALPALPAPTTAKQIRDRAGSDLAYRFNLGGGLKSSGQWISGSGATTAEAIRDGDHVRLRFFDPDRRDMADEPVVDLRLTRETARRVFADLQAAVDAPFDLKAWAAQVAPRLKRTPEQVEASVLADEQAREGAIRLNINRQAMQFVANRPPFADESHVLSAHPRGKLDATRVCLMLSPEATKHTSQNCTMIAYLTLDAARALAQQGLKAAE